MPVVFSPGEPETRPLDPDAIVYTTGDKIGQLLGIAAGEPVDGAADAASTGFYITGTDLREHGFESGDTIFVYSDLDPLGTEFTITAPAVEDVSGTKYVKLPTTIATPANYTTAANTFIQNKAIFTNGKSRGVTKDIINTRIREIQDRIDNYTHNAWRPYLVAAEYLNFDTYKPYRRRYYTDYVGTTPLLFRNVQQILRLEVWQGDDYRELAGAEARLEFKDTGFDDTPQPTITIGLQGGYKADLGGTNGAPSSGTFDTRFDKVSTAQSLADLINKEDRVGKSALEFQRSDASYLTLAGSSSNVAVHNEIIASANSDYGNGKLKITSLRQTKGGETVSIASTDLTNISISQVTEVSTTSSGRTGTSSNFTLTVPSTEGFARGGVVMIGDGTGDNVVTFSYRDKTATTLTSCNNLNGDAFTALNTDDTRLFQYLLKSDIGAFSDAGGDQARLKDWWLDSEMGIVYFNNSYPFFEWNAVKATYIYGERYVEKAIEEAATKLVASELLMADDRSVLIPEGTQNIDLGSKAQLWRREAMDILSRYKEVVAFL